ncbi:MAG: molybdopterin-binding protein [Aestuariivita sp.]|nr:molybdopterin-binding protein [Aestuariivita sp.]
MKFGPVNTSESEGAILAHSMVIGDLRFKKGITLKKSDIIKLIAAGITEVIVATLDEGDQHENVAVKNLSQAIVPDPKAANLCMTEPFTGRVNFIAKSVGVAILDVNGLNEFNVVDPMIGISTVPPFQQVNSGMMVATLKIISYAVAGSSILAASDAARNSIRVKSPVFNSASLITTTISGVKLSEKGRRVVESRVAALGMELINVVNTPHNEHALAAALTKIKGDIILILTASATSDLADIGPSAVRFAGGKIDRFGMPVDPGNLLFLGSLLGRPVIGLPGCARSPSLNGVDWILSRVACGVSVTSADISKMGVGGLLKEIPTRPQPRIYNSLKGA